MQNIEQFITDNKEFIDGFEPEEGHFERFNKKLKEKNNKKFYLTTSFLLKAAAVFVFIIVCSSVIYYYFDVPKVVNLVENSKIIKNKQNLEFQEAEIYYQTSFEAKYKEFEKLKNCSKSELDIEMINQELKELDAAYTDLKKELTRNANKDEIRNAMIECYQNKIDLLNQIINKVAVNC